jgi:hypothetical protein
MLATLGVLVAAAGVDLIFSPQVAKAAQESAKTPVVREELILQGSPAQLQKAYYSLASRRLITIQSEGGKETLSGVAGAGQYDSLGRFEFSPDGLHTVFMATRNKRLFAVLDGKEVGGHENVENVDNVTLSPDGQHLAFYAWKDKQWVMVVDGKEGPPSHGLRSSSPSIFGFSPDSRRLAYVIDLGRNKFQLVVDGVPAAECRGVIRFLFSPDSQHWAATVRQGFMGRPVLVVDGQDSSFKLDASGALQFNPATKKVAVIGVESGWQGQFRQVGVHEMHLPEKHKYTFETGPGGIQLGVWGPYFSADGKHDVYAIHDSRGEDVFADGEIIFSTRTEAKFLWQKQSAMPWERLHGLVLSGDGRRLAIVASSKDRVGMSLAHMGEDTATGHWTVLAKREIEIPINAKGEVLISNLLLSPSGEHVAFEVHTKGDDFVVVDGEEGRHYESSSNLQRGAGFVEDGAKRGCHFEGEESVTCIVAKEGGLYRVTQTAPSTSPWPVPAKH